MKHIDLNVESCWQCPYVGWASFTNSESIIQSYFTYCKKKAGLGPSSSAHDVARLTVDTALLQIDGIPEWCPLPDAEEGDRT